MTKRFSQQLDIYFNQIPYLYKDSPMLNNPYSPVPSPSDWTSKLNSYEIKKDIKVYASLIERIIVSL